MELYVLDSHGPKADHLIHEVARTAPPLFTTICGKLAKGRRFKNPPIRLSYCQQCFETIAT